MNLFFGNTVGETRNGSLIRKSFFNLNDDFKKNARKYSRELLRREFPEEQQKIYERHIYGNVNKEGYQSEKIENYEAIAVKLRDYFKKSYTKALEDYSQAEALKISTKKTENKKKILMEEFNSLFPFNL